MTTKPKRNSEYGVGNAPPRRSIFGNYQAGHVAAAVPPAGTGAEQSSQPEPDGRMEHSLAGGTSVSTLQSAIDTAFARSFIYRFLAKAFEEPERDGWHWLSSSLTQGALESAAETLRFGSILAAEGQSDGRSSSLHAATERLLSSLTTDAFDSFHDQYVTCFGHTVRGDCPMNEIEYGDIKADPLFQPHRLADLGAFYAAFGLEMTLGAAERLDHISIESEFVSVLAAKETYALEHQLDGEPTDVCREAQRKFLREHLGRWTPAFTRRLTRMAGGTVLGALAGFTRAFITEDCARFKVTPGSEDLLLRPIDETSESLCASCGISHLPPGAARSFGDR